MENNQESSFKYPITISDAISNIEARKELLVTTIKAII